MIIRNYYIGIINKTITNFNIRPDTDYHSYFLPIIRPLFIVKNSGNFLYEFIGKYEGIDMEYNLIKFKCSNNKTYSFKVIDFETDIEKQVIKIKYGPGENGIIYIPNNVKPNEKYHILFESKRSITNILSEYSKLKFSSLNNETESIMLIYTN